MALNTDRVAIVGAGVAGLAAAIDLAAKGVAVTVFERAAAPGGKMREVEIAGARIDAGPTVLTMRWVFDELFEEAGSSFDRALGLSRAETLARHAWSEHERLDLFADVERSAEAIARLVDAGEAERYRRFSRDARAIYETLESSFLRAVRPGPLDLVRSAGLRGIGQLARIRPFTSLWRALGEYFHDPRTRQLFGRYATYVGSSPFWSPATLMLIAHVEREGVWLVEGGMHRVARALADLATTLGVVIRYDEGVARVVPGGSEGSVGFTLRLTSGARFEADAVIANADVETLASGHLGEETRRAIDATRRRQRSLSAVTWARVAATDGFPLLRHNVFFSADYSSEFQDLFGRGRLPLEPTVYVCAQDRESGSPMPAGQPERLFCLVNAPPNGDDEPLSLPEVQACEARMTERLRSCGLQVEATAERTHVTSPKEWNRLFPGTGGSLYGRNAHGWRASFQRPGPRTRLPGLYLAGGCTHPGPGVPMAALSGRQAAMTVLADLASTVRSSRTAISGGTSTR